jgi:outer membrane receptor protein involved in Fe transport
VLPDAPQAATVVTSAELLTSAAGSLDDALRNTPGFSLFRRSSSRVSNPTTQGVTLRGLSGSGASRTLVLADGFPLNDPFGSWVYWNRVPQAAIDRVEIVRGATGDLYGADALGGVVQVLTFAPGRTRLRGIVEAGSHGTARFSGFAGGQRRGASEPVRRGPRQRHAADRQYHALDPGIWRSWGICGERSMARAGVDRHANVLSDVQRGCRRPPDRAAHDRADAADHLCHRNSAVDARSGHERGVVRRGSQADTIDRGRNALLRGRNLQRTFPRGGHRGQRRLVRPREPVTVTYVDPRGFTGWVQGRALGTQFDDDLNVFELESFGVVDASASQALRRGLHVFAAVKNLLNADYDVGRTPIRTIGWPRTVRIGVRVFLP